MAILETHGGHCRDCYKCIRYCPLKAIHFSDDQALIMQEQCIHDGLCSNVCPQGAKEIVPQYHTLQQWIDEGRHVVVLMSPAYLGLRDDPHLIISSLRALGVQRIEETAWAVPAVSAQYWQASNGNPSLLSSCPALVRLVEVHYPKLTPHLVPTASPMTVHARSARQRFPEARIVYVGPCTAKKWERQQSWGDTDLVLTFQEVYRGLRNNGISLGSQRPVAPDISGSATARQFPLVNGWEKTWSGDDIQGKTWAISGFQECIDFLESMQAGRIQGQWANLMICPGGCLGGPGWNDYDKVFVRQSRLMDRIFSHQGGERPDWIPVDHTRSFAPAELERQTPSEQDIQDVLRSSGKSSLRDQIDCGACGYDSCRELAEAVLQGKAQLDMCIPSSRTQAETMSNIIIKATPNGIVVVDPEMRILSINPAAENMFQCSEQALKGTPVHNLLDTDVFDTVCRENRMIVNNCAYPHYGVSTRQIVFPVEGQDVIIGIFIDITQEQQRDEELQHLKQETLQRAGEVIEKQMRVAQEIAGLLGETTGETKILLTQLMGLMKDDGSKDNGGDSGVR